MSDRILTGPDLREDELDMKAQWQRRRAHHATRIAAVLTAFEAAEQGMTSDVSFFLDRAEAAMEIANWYHTELCRLVDMSGDTEVAGGTRSWRGASWLSTSGAVRVRENQTSLRTFVKFCGCGCRSKRTPSVRIA